MSASKAGSSTWRTWNGKVCIERLRNGSVEERYMSRLSGLPRDSFSQDSEECNE